MRAPTATAGRRTAARPTGGVAQRGIASCVAACALLASACGPAAGPPALPLQPEDFTLRGVPADADSTEIRLTFGDPDSIVESPNPFTDDGPLIAWIYDGFEVRFASGGTPSGYMIAAPGESTARGATVGAPAQLLLRLYGEPAARQEQGWTYADTTADSALRVIQAVIRTDTIRSIYIGWALP